MKKKSIEILVLATAFFIVLFSNIILSNPSPFTDPRNCSDVFINCINDTTDDVIITSNRTACNGIEYNGPNGGIEEVYINATNFFPNSGINVTCKYQELESYVNYIYIWYYNGSDWFSIQNFTNTSTAVQEYFNVSAVFNVNSTLGPNVVRCIYSLNMSGRGQIPIECANTTYSFLYDNDDVNFTVTSHLTYDFWNLTNYTNGSEIASGQTYNRNTSINVSARWNKNISYAAIEINGTGSWTNYTIASPYTDNWTNYTINLSDATKYNQYNITINTIYVNDTTSATNNTSPLLFFYLDIGLEPPNISSYWLQPLTNRTNLYTNLTIYANVSDDSGISTVRANLTYPSNTSIILNLTGDPNPENRTWNYTFRTTGFTLNETGNYTVWWVSVKDNGNQEVNLTQNLTFYVTNNLTVNISVPSLTPGKGTPINPVSISIYDVNNNFHQFLVNLTIRCLNISYVDTNFSLTNVNGQTTFTNCYAPNLDSTSFSITVNATDQYNNHNYTVITLTTQSSGGDTIISGGGGSGGMGSTKNVTIIQNITLNATQQSIRDFNFTLSSSSVEIEQGQDATIIGSLFNIGNQPLVLNATLESKCCNITLPKGFELGVKKETAFSIKIHVPLFQDLGEYVVNVSLSTSGITKEKAFKIIVKKSTSINSLNDLEKKLSGLESQVAEYEKLGMDVNDLKRMIENTKQLLSGGKFDINKDNSANLKNSLDNANKIISSLSSKLLTLGVQKFLHQNKYNIGLALTTIVLTTYTATQVIYPYHKLSQELKFLTEEEAALVQSRIDAERQFFKRIINEQTFTNIMITKQEKVLRTRAMLKLKQEEKAGLIKSKLSPKAFAGWIKNGSINTFYTIKSSPRNIVDKIKSKMKREEVKSY